LLFTQPFNRAANLVVTLRTFGNEAGYRFVVADNDD
jgi:hypothetical protein